MYRFLFDWSIYLSCLPLRKLFSSGFVSVCVLSKREWKEKRGKHNAISHLHLIRLYPSLGRFKTSTSERLLVNVCKQSQKKSRITQDIMNTMHLHIVFNLLQQIILCAAAGLAPKDKFIETTSTSKIIEKKSERKCGRRRNLQKKNKSRLNKWFFVCVMFCIRYGRRKTKAEQLTLAATRWQQLYDYDFAFSCPYTQIQNIVLLKCVIGEIIFSALSPFQKQCKDWIHYTLSISSSFVVQSLF